MGFRRNRMRGGRPDSLRRSRNTTRIPSSLLKELEDLQDSDSGYDSAGTAGSSTGSGQASQTHGQPAHRRQLSRKERRKQLRLQQRQQKNAHQKLRKGKRMQQEVVYAASQLCSNGQREDQLHLKRKTTGSGEAGLTKVDEEGLGSLNSEDLFAGPLHDGESIGAAAAALREAQKRELQGDDALQRELRLLERRLGVRRGNADCTESLRARAKLRKELEADGFDLELQGILEGCTKQAKVVHPVGNDDGNSPRKALLGKRKEVGKSGESRAMYAVSKESGNIGMAAAVLQEDQKREQSHDPLREELKILEKRLGISGSCSSKTNGTQEKKRRKLREELAADGFDLELQDVLDDILGTGTREAGGSAPGKPVGEPSCEQKMPSSVDASGLKEDDVGDSEAESDCVSMGTDSTCSFDKSSEEPVECEAPQSDFRKAVEQNKENEGREHTSKVYVAPHRRLEASGGSDTAASEAALEAVKIEVVRALNRVSEGNVEPVFRQLLLVIQKAAADLRLRRENHEGKAELLRTYSVGVRGLVCDQLMQSCIRSPFSTNSLIATQTALCCALGKMWDIELCRDFLGSLAVCFSSHFARALVQRSEQREDLEADSASLTTRHAVVGVCCLYDFGFVSPHLFVELILRVSGLRMGSKGMGEHNIELSDFRVELLLLLLRLGGEKLRQDDTTLFASTWKELECLVQRQGSSQSQLLPVLEGGMADAGRLRALLLELQDVKAGKQKGRLMLIKASQTALRRWLSSSTVFGPSFLSTQFQIGGSWEDLEQGKLPELSRKAAAAAHCQQQQQLQTGEFKSAPDAFASGAVAKNIRQQAALLRFNTELQQSLFECFVTANSPDDALQLLQNSGHLSMKKNIITQTVAVAMQCCLQEKFYNQFYGIVLSRLCGICGCQGAGSRNNACKCFLIREKGAARYRRTIQRGLAAQASAAHGFSVRRLLNLAKLTAFLIRLHVADLRIVRFLNFDSAGEKQGPMGLSGKLGVFLREICVELLCCPEAAASPLPAREDWKQSAVEYFGCLGTMSDICEAFIAVLQDVVLPSISANAVSKSSAEQALKASVVKSAIRTLLAHQEQEM